MTEKLDPKIIDMGERYILRRFPLLQIESREKVHRAVADLMFMARNAQPVASE